jgi:hypothetical protein
VVVYDLRSGGNLNDHRVSKVELVEAPSGELAIRHYYEAETINPADFGTIRSINMSMDVKVGPGNVNGLGCSRWLVKQGANEFMSLVLTCVGTQGEWTPSGGGFGPADNVLSQLDLGPGGAPLKFGYLIQQGASFTPGVDRHQVDNFRVEIETQ